MADSDEEYRRRVLQPRPGFRREDWKAVPRLSWGSRQPGLDLDDQMRFFLRWLMAAVDETIGAAGDPLQFVVLMKVEAEAGEVDISLVCPHEEPLALMRDGDPRRDLPRIAELGIAMRCALPVSTRVPLVLECDRSAGRYAFSNENQISAPRQFMNPYWTRTTSGFLNMVGAREIDGAEMMVMSNLDAMHDQGVDEWFRWLYCTMETGVSFDSGKLLVRRGDPETWIYDYDGE